MIDSTQDMASTYVTIKYLESNSIMSYKLRFYYVFNNPPIKEGL